MTWVEDAAALLWESPWVVPSVGVGFLILALLFMVTGGGRWPE